MDGQARAYSLNLLNAHEVVNDRFGDRPVAVIWCPLANAGAAYDRRVKERELHFETSGVLMNGSIVVQDKETDTFWPLILGKAAVGPLKGTPLTPLPATVKAQWKDWRRDHPETLVWSFAGEEHIERSPYQSYIDSPFGHKGIAATDTRLRTKDSVYGFELAGRHYAVPFPAFVGGPRVRGGRAADLPLSARETWPCTTPPGPTPPRWASRRRPGAGSIRRPVRASTPTKGAFTGPRRAEAPLRLRHVLVHLEPDPSRHGGRGRPLMVGTRRGGRPLCVRY